MAANRGWLAKLLRDPPDDETERFVALHAVWFPEPPAGAVTPPPRDAHFSNRVNHAHLDLGTFTLDADGVRWADPRAPFPLHRAQPVRQHDARAGDAAAAGSPSDLRGVRRAVRRTHRPQLHRGGELEARRSTLFVPQAASNSDRAELVAGWIATQRPDAVFAQRDA